MNNHMCSAVEVVEEALIYAVMHYGMLAECIVRYAVRMLLLLSTHSSPLTSTERSTLEPTWSTSDMPELQTTTGC